MPLASTTELEAVNVMLRAIGEAPVSTLSGTTTSDVNAAVSILAETSREVQAMGLHCNTEYNYTIAKDGDGYINLPSNCMRVDVDPNGSCVAMDVCQRGSRLYDLKNRTSVFTQDVIVRMTLLLDFTDLPEAVRYYITCRAARRLQERVLGASEVQRDVLSAEAQAKALMLDAESETADHTIFDNYTVYRTLDRSSNIW